MAALAIAAALAGRQRTGRGCFLDVSMLEASISAMGWAVSNYLVSGVAAGADGGPERHRRAVRHVRRRRRPAQHRRQPAGAVRDAVPPGRPARPARPTPVSPTARRRKATGRRSTTSSTRRCGPGPRWSGSSCSPRPACPRPAILTVPQAVELDQLAHRGFFTDLPFPDGPAGACASPATGCCVDGEPLRPRASPPLLGEHNEEYAHE